MTINGIEIKQKINKIDAVSKLIHNDLSIFINRQQMIDLLSKNELVLAFVLTNNIRNKSVRKLVFNHFCNELLGHDWPSDRAMLNMEPDEFSEFTCELIAEAIDRGYIYNSDSNGIIDSIENYV